MYVCVHTHVCAHACLSDVRASDMCCLSMFACVCVCVCVILVEWDVCVHARVLV